MRFVAFLFALSQFVAYGYEYYEDFSVVDRRGGAYGIDIERNSTLSHAHGWVEGSRYRIPVNGNRHFLATPKLRDFSLSLKYDLVRFERLDFTLGFSVFFRYDRALRAGNRLDIYYDRFLKLHIALDGKDVFVRQDKDPLDLAGHELIFDVSGNSARVQTLGADVSFEIPASKSDRGQVGFDLTINEGVKLILSSVRLSSDEIPESRLVGKWDFQLSKSQGFVQSPRYEVEIRRFATGGAELSCRLSGLVHDLPPRTETGGREWTRMLERLSDPYVKLTFDGGRQETFYLWNGRHQFAHRRPSPVPGKWPLERKYFISDIPQEFCVSAGYSKAMSDPWRFAANGPWEQIQNGQGDILYEGEALSKGKIALAVHSPEDKKIVERIPQDLPERGRALKHAIKGHYFLESEIPSFTIETLWFSNDYSTAEICPKVRLENVFGRAAGLGVKPTGAMKVKPVAQGILLGRQEFALSSNPGVGVWHLETDAGAGNDVRSKRTVFEVLSDRPGGVPPPIASGLPTFVAMPNEIKYLEESAFDPWSELGGVSHYFSIDMRYPAIGDKLRVWEGDHIYDRKYFTWLVRRNTCDTNTFGNVNLKRLENIDYVCAYPDGKHNEGRFDFAQTKFYTRKQLQILEDFIREKKLSLKFLTPKRLDEVRLRQRGIEGEELQEIFDLCWDEFKAYAKKRVDEYMQEFVDRLLSVNPKIARASYGPMPIYTASFKSPYTLETNSHPVENDPRIRANGSFFLLEDYHYSCDYPLCRPGYFVAAYSLIHPQGRRIFPEIYYEGWSRCSDGAVYQAHPDKYPRLAKSHQRRIAYQFAYGTAFMRDDGSFGYWRDYGFHARNPDKEAMDEFLYAWGNVVSYSPAAPLKSPFVIVDCDQFRCSGDRYEADGSYALVGPGFNDVRSDVINTAEEDVGYAYERCCAEGYSTPVVAKLNALKFLTKENCQFVILPPLPENTPKHILDDVRSLHSRGVNLICFEKAHALSDIFDTTGKKLFAKRETSSGRTVFVKSPPTQISRSTFKARYQRGRDTVDANVPLGMKDAFRFLAPEPSLKAERGTLLASRTANGETIVILSDDSPLYGDTDDYPQTFRFSISMSAIDSSAIRSDAEYSVVEKGKDKLVIRTKTQKDTALFFLFSH